MLLFRIIARMKYYGIYFNLCKKLGLVGNGSVYARAVSSSGHHFDLELFSWWLLSPYAQEQFKRGSWFPGVQLAAAELCSGSTKEFSATLCLLLSDGKASSCQIALRGLARMKAATPLPQHCALQDLQQQTGQDISATFTSPNYQNSLLMACQVIHPIHLNFVYDTAIKDVH